MSGFRNDRLGFWEPAEEEYVKKKEEFDMDWSGFSI